MPARRWLAFGAYANASVQAAVYGAAIIAAAFAVFLVVTEDRPLASIAQFPYAVGNLVIFSGYAFIVSWGVFWICGLVVGPPMRWLLQRLQLWGRTSASLAGALVSGLVASGLASLLGPLEVGWLFPLLAVALAGAVAGLRYFYAVAPNFS